MNKRPTLREAIKSLFYPYMKSVIDIISTIKSAAYLDAGTSAGMVPVLNVDGKIVYTVLPVATLEQLQAAASNLIVSSDILSSFTIKQGKHTIWVPAESIRPTKTNGCASTASITTTASTHPDIVSNDYDYATQEYGQIKLCMEKSWNKGTLTFIHLWSHGSTSSNYGVAWGVRGVSTGDNETLGGTAYGTAVVVTDTGGTTNNVYITAESSAMTIANTPALNDLVTLQIYREVANAADTLAVDARHLGMLIFYTNNAADDS